MFSAELIDWLTHHFSFMLSEITPKEKTTTGEGVDHPHIAEKVADKVVELISNKFGCKQDKESNNENKDLEEEKGQCKVKRPSDCMDLDKSTCKSGIYKVYPENTFGFNVFCEMEEHGNENLHQLISQGKYMLRIDMSDFENNKIHAVYRNSLIISDGMKVQQNGNKFTTMDKDNDVNKDINCAVMYKGGCWYGSCHESNLNGLYLKGSHKTPADGVNWLQWKGHHYSLKTTTMMIRRT
ncbi:FCN [Mytilus coruscus]|uniref:FCN n=1 Tax=Mytilus coruscus TaxID=42192 RepID=A0A6J8DV74_MYTCO|nr:FCN [Mytilus coruscus]